MNFVQFVRNFDLEFLAKKEDHKIKLFTLKYYILAKLSQIEIPQLLGHQS